MKKKIIPILVCLMLAVGVALTGCGNSFSKIKVEGKQDTSYTVYSQGGMAVQYGNYVYFINGYAGYEDADGKQNTWPDVVKGGLYRAELNGAKSGNDFVVSKNTDALTDGLEFKSTVQTGYSDEQIDVVNAQPIAPKRIGTSGYTDGGIFIYDEWVYFASPNNEKNKAGTVQTGKTDFFRVKLDGSKTQKIYTTDNDGNESNPYAFYKYNGAVYLVAQDGTDVISVKTDKKPRKKVTIASGVTSVVLPYSDTYYNGMNENTLNHFVYVLRAVTEDDLQRAGNVIEIMRPDGKSGGVYHSQGNTADALEAVRDGLLFYRTTDKAGNTLINYDSLHDFLMGNDEYVDDDDKKHEAGSVYGDEAYKAYYSKEGVSDPRIQLSGTILATKSASDYTSTYCFRPGGESSNLVYMLGVKASAVELRSSLHDTVTVRNEGITLLSVEDKYMYFTVASANESNGTATDTVYRTEWNRPAGSEETKLLVSDKAYASSGFGVDYCAGYVTYIGTADEFAESYTLFKQVERAEGTESVFVGVKTTADTLAAPSLSVKKKVISWGAVENADSYNLYRKSGDGAVLVADGITETQYTVSDAGEYYAVSVGGTNGLTSVKSNTVKCK